MKQKDAGTETDTGADGINVRAQLEVHVITATLLSQSCLKYTPQKSQGSLANVAGRLYIFPGPNSRMPIASGGADDPSIMPGTHCHLDGLAQQRGSKITEPWEADFLVQPLAVLRGPDL